MRAPHRPARAPDMPEAARVPAAGQVPFPPMPKAEAAADEAPAVEPPLSAPAEATVPAEELRGACGSADASQSGCAAAGDGRRRSAAGAAALCRRSASQRRTRRACRAVDQAAVRLQRLGTRGARAANRRRHGLRHRRRHRTAAERGGGQFRSGVAGGGRSNGEPAWRPRNRSRANRTGGTGSRPESPASERRTRRHPEIGRGRWHGLHALCRRFDRSRAAARHAAFRVDQRSARAPGKDVLAFGRGPGRLPPVANRAQIAARPAPISDPIVVHSTFASPAASSHQMSNSLHELLPIAGRHSKNDSLDGFMAMFFLP